MERLPNFNDPPMRSKTTPKFSGFLGQTFVRYQLVVLFHMVEPLTGCLLLGLGFDWDSRIQMGFFPLFIQKVLFSCSGLRRVSSGLVFPVWLVWASFQHGSLRVSQTFVLGKCARLEGRRSYSLRSYIASLSLFIGPARSQSQARIQREEK